MQRLELSVKALHTYLGVAPVLNSSAVADGRGQEELLSYLLNLKNVIKKREQLGLFFEELVEGDPEGIHEVKRTEHEDLTRNATLFHPLTNHYRQHGKKSVIIVNCCS